MFEEDLKRIFCNTSNTDLFLSFCCFPLEPREPPLNDRRIDAARPLLLELVVDESSDRMLMGEALLLLELPLSRLVVLKGMIVQWLST